MFFAADEGELPENGGDHVSDEKVEDLSGFLCVDNVHAECGGVVDAVSDGLFGDFVEDGAWGGGDGEVEFVADVPSDGFAFAVVVGGDDDVGGVADGVS